MSKKSLLDRFSKMANTKKSNSVMDDSPQTFHTIVGSSHADPFLSGVPSKPKNLTHWQTVLRDDVLALTRTRECFSMIEDDPMLGYDLPKKSCTLLGQVLKHCYGVVDKLFEAQYPCIYKFGFTHCASFRFHNAKFGYKHEQDLWQKMIVVYASSEPVSPGFVEAALIQRHKGFLIAFTLGNNGNKQSHATIMQATFHHVELTCIYDRGSDRGVVM